MGDLVNERIIQLGSAHEYMVQAAEIMDQMDLSKHKLEKNAYESMNTTDKTINLSKEGLKLINHWKASFSTYIENPTEIQLQQMNTLLDSIGALLNQIKVTATNENASLHTIEKEVAIHGELTEELRHKFDTVKGSLEQAIACAELVLAMEV